MSSTGLQLQGDPYTASRMAGEQQKQQRDQFHQQNVMGNNPTPQVGAPQPYVGQGIPPTGLQKQLTSLNQYYDQVRNAQMVDAQGGIAGMGAGGTEHIGFDPAEQQYQQFQAAGGEKLYASQVGQADPGQEQQQPGSNLNQMARTLAEDYGLPIGRGDIVDEFGNLKVNVEQLVAASGGTETIGSAGMKLNYISDAISRRINEERKQAGIAAIQTGIGQMRNRGRGSLSGVMSGMYEALAQQYQQSADFEGPDYSYFILKEKENIEAELRRKQEKQLKRQARINTIMGAVNVVVGAYSGNYGAVTQGAGQIASSSEETGWF